MRKQDARMWIEISYDQRLFTIWSFLYILSIWSTFATIIGSKWLDWVIVDHEINFLNGCKLRFMQLWCGEMWTCGNPIGCIKVQWVWVTKWSINDECKEMKLRAGKCFFSPLNGMKELGEDDKLNLTFGSYPFPLGKMETKYYKFM